MRHLLIALLFATHAMAGEVTTMKPDYSELKLKANGMYDDSVAHTLQAAGRLFGREADYETLACLTANVFAPHVQLKEDCMSHWMVTALFEMNGLPTAAAYLGLSAQKLPLPEFAGDWRNAEECLGFRKKCAVVIRQALDDGAVVLTEGGWDIKGPKGFVHWGLAGLITHGDPADGTVRGAHLWGQRDHPIHIPGTATYALRPSGEMRPLAEFHATILRQATERILGRGAYSRTEEVVYGLDAMDAWIKMMSEAPGYCAPCFKKVGATAGDALNNARRVSNGAKVAAKFLRKLGPQYEAAAKRYDRIVELLEPALADKGGKKYGQFLGDMAKQKAHAETVLVPVKAELAAAAEEIEKALSVSAPKAPDPAKLARLASHGHHPEDPFSLTLQAVAAAFGREVNYDEVFALSSNCFAPDIRPDEECRSSWRLRGRGQCLDLVADRLGLKVRPLGCFCPKYPQAKKGDEVAALVRQALADGDVVITDSGWQHDFMLWGIVTGVRADGRFVGVTPNGKADNTFDHLCSFWALSPKPPGLSQREADLETLRRAVARIRADREPFLVSSLACGLPATGSPEVAGAVVWGLAAMDRWMEQMKRVPYQQDDAGSSAGNARLCALHTLHGAEVAARQLREMAARLGPSARPHLEAAMLRYERIVALLRPAVTGDGAESYGQIMGDAAKQKAHADTVLTPAKAELYAAAGELEKARVSAEGPAPGEVLLQPIADAYDAAVKARRSMNHARSELVCRLALLHAQGAKDVSYDDLVVAAGWGTAFVFHPTKSWLIFSPPDDPRATEDRLTQAAGWRWQPLGDCKGKPDEAWAVLVKSIDAGRGVVGAFLDDYVFAGYRDAALKRDRKVYHLGGWEPNGWWTWDEFEKWCREWGRFGGHVEEAPRADPRAELLGAMRLAVKFSKDDGRKTVAKFADGAYGLAGLEAYAEAVGDTARDPDAFEGGWLGCYCINRQHYARESAANWFRARAGRLEEPARAHLLQAAGHYDAACAAWKEFESVLGRGTGKTKLEDLKVLWRDPAARKAGAAAVRGAFAHEGAAIAELDKALAAVTKGERPMALKREGSRVWIEGVPDGKFGIQWDLFIKAVQKLFEFRGVKAGLDELLAHSGDAFNLCHASHWQGTAYLAIPTDPLANLARAYGFEYSTTHQGERGGLLGRPAPQKQVWMDAASKQLRAEIDAGRPVLGAGLEAHCGSCTLVVGYEGEWQALCHVGDAAPYRWSPVRGVTPGAPNDDFGLLDGRCRGTVTRNFVGGWQANPLYFFGARMTAPVAEDLRRIVLRRAVELHRAPKFHRGNWGGVDYSFGAEAYRHWAADLHSLDYPADLKKRQPKDAYDWYNLGNMDTQVDQIVRGRTAAAEFCERAGVPEAARLYREEVAIAREAFGVFMPPWDGNDAPRVAWLSDKAKCESGAVAIERMAQKEAGAIAAIERSLAVAE